MTKFLQDLLFNGELTVQGAVTLNSTLEVNSTGSIRHGLTTSDYGGVNTTYSLLALTGTNSQTFGVKNGATYVSGSIGVFDNYSQPFYFYTNRGFNFIPANSRSSSTVDWIYAGGTMFVAGGNPNQSNGWVSIKPTFNYNGVPDTGTKYIGLYYSPTNYLDLGSQHYAIVADAGKVEFGDLAGTGTRMVTATSTGLLETAAIPQELVINNNGDYRVITGSSTANTVNANTKLAWYNDYGILYLEATASWGYGAEIDFDNRSINGTQWGIYGGDPSHPGMVMYRYLPSGKDVTYWDIDKFNLASDVKLGFSSTTSALGEPDVALSRESAGLIQINNGTVGTYASLKALHLTTTGNANINGELNVNSRFIVGTYDTGSGGDNLNTYLQLSNYNNDAYGEGLVLGYGRGTIAAPLNVQTGDVIGGLYYRAYSEGAGRNLSYIESSVVGYSTYAKTKLCFATGAGDSYAYVGMILNEDAKLFLGYNLFDQGAYRLQIDGSIYASGALLTSLAGTGSRMVVADASGTLSTTSLPGETDTLYTVTQRGNTTHGDIVVNGKGSFTDHVTINADSALFAGSAYNGYKMLGIGSTAGGGVSFVSNNGIAAEVFGDNGPTGLYLASYGAVPVITFYLNTTEVAKYKTTGELQISNLSGTGSRMVTADASGVLGTQAIPTAITNYVTTDTTQNIVGQKTFKALTTIFDSNDSATFIEGRASGVLYGGISFGLFMQYNAYPAATQGYLWKNGLGSNVMALTQTGVLNLAVLSGTGTRMVVADTNGNLGVQTVPTGSLQGAVDADKNTSGSLAIGTTSIKEVSASTYSGVFFDYVVKNGTNVRVGSVVAITNGTTVEFYETLSNDIGTTTALTFTVTLSSGNINLNAVATGTGWTVIVSTRAI